MLIQSPTCMELVISSGRQGILVVMPSRQLLFEASWIIFNSESPFHLLFAGFQRSLIREQPEYAKAFPSLRPLVPSGVPFTLRMEGLPKRGYLRISVALVGSVLIRPGLTFSQAPIILFHIEHWVLLSLGTVKIQLMSGVLGPLP